MRTLISTSLLLVVLGVSLLAATPNDYEVLRVTSPHAIVVEPIVVQDNISMILDGMEICGNHLSLGRRQVLAGQIDRISTRYFSKPEYRQAFVGLLCIESKFDSSAKSGVGAIGIAQLMPKYAMYFSEQCDLGKISDTDLGDTEVNLTLGACHFSKLLDALGGNIALALSGYNSGQDSDTTRRLSKLTDGNPETNGYISKFYVYLNKVQIAGNKDQGVISKSIGGKTITGTK